MPESQFFNSSLLTVVKHTFRFQSYRDNPLKHFIRTLCATFTLLQMYLHKYTRSQYFMQLLLSSPYICIEKKNLKEYLSINTFKQ